MILLAIGRRRLTILEGNSSIRPRIRSYWDTEAICPSSPVYECCGMLSLYSLLIVNTGPCSDIMLKEER